MGTNSHRRLATAAWVAWRNAEHLHKQTLSERCRVDRWPRMAFALRQTLYVSVTPERE